MVKFCNINKTYFDLLLFTIQAISNSIGYRSVYKIYQEIILTREFIDLFILYSIFVVVLIAMRELSSHGSG